KLKNLKKKHFLGFTGLVILLIGLFWHYSISNQSRNIASEKDCNEIEIFGEYLVDLSACKFKEKLQYEFSTLSDIKITNYQDINVIGHSKMKDIPIYERHILGRFDLSGNKDDIEVQLVCYAHLYNATVTINIECGNNDYIVSPFKINFYSILNKHNDDRDILH
ncbi:MAG: hypothetical protein OXB84_04310, partial [Halobacteriovoraceae bacterium]|nr:hypothetical protein [Halobacteriovoraceae bacterium]